VFKNVHIETERLIIRPFSLNDAEALHEIVSQEEVMKYLPEDVMSMEEVQGVLSWLTDCYKKNTPECILKFTLAMVSKHDQMLIGWCGLGPLDFEPEEIEIFYGLSEDQWGKGMATEAARAVLHYGFDTIKLDKIAAVTHAQNVASVRIIEKLGMLYRKKIEKLPEKYRSYEGCLYYSLCRDEYLQIIKA
jgi:ribosomal-protein-alanine N-acetyltransferase